jgi:chemotaxis protein CheD
MGRAIMAGMAELKVSCDPGDVLMALGLGSCIGICAYDSMARVAGMVHVVLPECPSAQPEMPGKFANTAVPALLEEMQRRGALTTRIRVAIAGGAKLFSFGGGEAKLEIGNRNAEAVISALKRHRLLVSAQDTGGASGRTVLLVVADGSVRIKTIGQGERELICLRDVSSQVYLAKAA